MPVILCTGYSERIMEQRAKGLGIREYLLKPIEIGELARAIRKALEPDKKQE
jgi:two-component system, cell cycle sensor histidine kinase and response regulator CckA